MSNGARKSTTKLHQMMDAGELDPRTVANACLEYMSEDEVNDMAENEEFIEVEEEEEQDEEENEE